MAELLNLESVWAGYGDAVVLEDISFSLQVGGSLALLGRNGMGKTTLLSTLMGATRFKSGRMSFAGQDLALIPSMVVHNWGSAGSRRSGISSPRSASRKT